MSRFKKLNLKKTFFKNKLVSIFTLVILLFAIIAGFLLVQQNQDLRKKADSQTCQRGNEGQACTTSGGCSGTCVNDSNVPSEPHYVCLASSACGDGNDGCTAEQRGNCKANDYGGCKDGSCINPTGGGGGGGTPVPGRGGGGQQGGGGGGIGGAIERFLQYFYASIDIKGGVKAGETKFTKETCSGTNFVTDAGISVTAKKSGNILTAIWDCVPDFTFYQKRVRSGDYKVTLLPPSGYTCDTVTVTDRSTNKTIKAETGCQVTINLKGKTAPMYIQYEVKK